MREISAEEGIIPINAAGEFREARLRYMEKMRIEGYTILIPEEDELFIDIDTDDQYEHFNKYYKRLVLQPGLTETTYKVVPSKSGYPHRHIIVKLPIYITEVERIALQAILGSDPTRELLSIFRNFNTDIVPTLFVRKEQ